MKALQEIAVGLGFILTAVALGTLGAPVFVVGMVMAIGIFVLIGAPE